jgi:hypothetical protein
MTTIAPGGALHEGPTRPRALRPGSGPHPEQRAEPAPEGRRRGPLVVAVVVAAGAAIAGLGALGVLRAPLGPVRPPAPTARPPAAAVPVVTGVQLFDVTGADLGVTAAAPSGVPQVVAGSDPGAVASRVDGAAVAEALAVRAQLPPALAGEVTTYGATSTDGVWLALRDGARVLWGSAERTEDKVAALAALRAASPHAARYDVSAPEAPAVTRR